MGHDKLRKFAENETFRCLLQPSASEALADGYDHLRDHAVKGHWYPEMFPVSAPLVLELGCGKGEYTIALAERDHSRNHVGVDIKGARLWKGAKHATLHGMSNVAFMRARIEFIQAYFAPGEVSEIWLTFPDPQYKSPNSRLSSPVFLERYRKFLVSGGVVHLKTDSKYLHEYTKAVCAANGLEVLACTDDLYADHSESIPGVAREVQTFYESIFLEQGYKISYMSFRITGDSPLVAPADFDSDYWRSVEGDRQIFGRDTAETRRQKLKRPADAED